jgi:protein involved in polysaccharide export with SLBB domain
MWMFVSRAAFGSLVLLSAAQVAAGENGAPGPARTWSGENRWVGLDRGGTASAVHDDEIGGGDKLKITLVGNPDLSGEFRVQADGTVTLPVLGSFFVAGRTPNEIGEMVTERFIHDTRRSGQTNVVVDVVEWRPVFVTGGVSKPGAYAYMPGMTVLHAISQSGGLYRIADGDISTFINVAQNVSRMQEVQEALKYSLVRVASLNAELAGQSELKLPEMLLQIVGPDSGRVLLETEKRALDLRLQTAANDLDLRRRQIESVRRELEEYRKQSQDLAKDLAAKRQQLVDLNAVMAKGMARRTDVLTLETYVNQLESYSRDLMTRTATTERELTKAEQELSDQPLLKQIRIQEELTSLRQKIASDQATLEGARLIVGQLGNDRIVQISNGGDESKRMFAIMRKVAGKDIFTSAGLDSRLQPGDVVIVDGKKQPGAGSSMFSAGGVQVPGQPLMSTISDLSAR